jgi:hypothetical protein
MVAPATGSMKLVPASVLWNLLATRWLFCQYRVRRAVIPDVPPSCQPNLIVGEFGSPGDPLSGASSFNRFTRANMTQLPFPQDRRVLIIEDEFLIALDLEATMFKIGFDVSPWRQVLG